MSNEIIDTFSNVIKNIVGFNDPNFVYVVVSNLTGLRNFSEVRYIEKPKKPYLPYGNLYKGQIEIYYDDHKDVISIVELPNNFFLVLVEINVTYSSNKYSITPYIIDLNKNSYMEFLCYMSVNMDLSGFNGYVINDFIFNDDFTHNESTYNLVTNCLEQLIGIKVNDTVIERLILNGLFETTYRELMYVKNLYCSYKFIVIDGTLNENYLTITRVIKLTDSMVLFLNLKKKYNDVYTYVSVHDLNTGEQLMKYVTR